MATTPHNNKSRDIRKLRNILLCEKRTELDRTRYEAKLNALETEIARLNQKLAWAAIEGANFTNNTEEMQKLREELITVAALITADIAKKEGTSSKIRELIKEPHGNNSLAARIQNCMST